MLAPGAEAEQLTGIERVLPRESSRAAPALARRTALYTTVRGETLGAGTPDRATAHARSAIADPWDGRPSREAGFIEQLRERASGPERAAAIRNLDPILDAMRMIKSPREIALVRESTRIAGLAIMEAMRSAEPGMYEYELEAIGDYVFKKHNAQGIAYFALVAAGKNAAWPHYHAAQSQTEGRRPRPVRLRAGLPLLHLGRHAHVSRERQVHAGAARALQVYLQLYQALMTSIRPNVTPASSCATRVRKMERGHGIVRLSQSRRSATPRSGSSKATGKAAPATASGHMVGMEVHDVTAPYDVLKPGMMFTIEPALTIPEERVYVRLEDVILITPTATRTCRGSRRSNRTRSRS